MTHPIKSECWIPADWPAPENIRAGTTIRQNGYSLDNFSSLNLATHVGDDVDNVEKNRKYLIESLDLPSSPVWLSQYHSNDIVCLNDNLQTLKADGAYTTQRNKICTVMTADCVPLLFCNQSGTQIMAIHAGWKGICKGIIENAIKIYADPKQLMVWIGPCIHAKHYEVGRDVYEACIQHLPMSQEAFIQTDNNHWHCDLVTLVKIILKNSQIGAIYECGLCTFEQEALFYSYRRDGETGRTASMIWME